MTIVLTGGLRVKTNEVKNNMDRKAHCSKSV